jgi:hypothetical protein
VILIPNAILATAYFVQVVEEAMIFKDVNDSVNFRKRNGRLNLLIIQQLSFLLILPVKFYLLCRLISRITIALPLQFDHFRHHVFHDNYGI